jgi:hypothetical protein
MAEELIERVAWESDEADTESDEAIMEAEDSVEDIGEASRRRRKSYYRPSRGVQGIAVPDHEGNVHKVQFPARLTTTAETNAAGARHELARRNLEDRLRHLEARSQSALRLDSSISGLVTLLVGGGLATYSAIQAGQQPSGSFAGNMAKQNSATMASLVSAAQIATTGAKLLMRGYHGSAVGTVADIFAVAQLAVYGYGCMYTPAPTVTAPDFKAAANTAKANGYSEGTVVILTENGNAYQVVMAGNIGVLRAMSNGA